MENHVKIGVADTSLPNHAGSSEEDKKFLSQTYTSKEDFTRDYTKLYFKTSRAGELYLLVLNELKEAISDGNVNRVKSLGSLVDYISDLEDPATLKNYYCNDNNPIKSTNLVILACKENRVSILEYLLSSDSTILNDLSYGISEGKLPVYKDETSHNAFYYAISSGNVELLDTLIHKWPENYFAVHVMELDTVLSQAYEELKLKNVRLPEKMQLYVESTLINLRFYSNTSGQKHNLKIDPHNTRERIQLMFQNIKLLREEYSATEEVDEKFVFIAKFIAQNIHILKRRLRSSYDTLPWEEIEFCLVSFVVSRLKHQEINLFYNATLNKHKILKHLAHFAKELENEIDISDSMKVGKLTELPKIKRGRVVEQIINKYPHFEELYNDHQQIKDIHSLDKISDYVKLALSADPKQREGQLIIIRVLQVIGEYLKNTLESPNLSSNTSDLLLLSLPRNTREIIVDLRNSLSHANSLSKRTQIEENKDVHFFIGVQNDTKKVGDVITNFLYNSKVKTIRILLKRIVESENIDEVKEVIEAISHAEFDQVLTDNFVTMEHNTLKKLIKELNDSVSVKTSHEKDLIDKINKIINCAESQANNLRTDFVIAFVSLKSLSTAFSDFTRDEIALRGMKFRANKILESIVQQIKPSSLKEVAKLSLELSRSLLSRTKDDNDLDEINRLTHEIFYIAEFGTGDNKWIAELRDKLNEKRSFIPRYKQRLAIAESEESYNNQLALKISELNNILQSNGLEGELFEKLPFLKKNKKLQAVLEMLVLDIMSILGTSKNNLENNLLFLDDNTPLLTGKCLRNHLAHDNGLVDILLSNSSTAVILNAKQLTSENIMKSKKKFGKLVKDDPAKLRDKFEKGLITVTNQNKMFTAIEDGNFEELNNHLKKGADMNGRNINSWTAIHFAAKGPSLETVKFVCSQHVDVNVRDTIGQNPLHIAAGYGRKDTVEFLVRQIGLNVNDVDNLGKTPLHIAAQTGHKDTVDILLENGANTFIKDKCGLSPLYYAIRNSHVEVSKALLGNDLSVDINKAIGGFTPLHEAAESGVLEMVKLLLQKKANVNARNDRDWTPLHAASYNGHLEIVDILIMNGADVNAIVINGCTSLFYAAESGHEKIAKLLLKHGAKVDAVDKTFNFTALHAAAKYGHEGIVKALLNNNANAKATNNTDMTSLHLAAQSGHLGVSRVLLSHGVNIDAKDNCMATPLHHAAENGHKGVVELLINSGSDINSRNKDKLTPLHKAALRGHTDVTDLLIKHKAKVDVPDIKLGTPLHAAAFNGNVDVLDLLIKSKAQVNTKTVDGMSPLHSAALNGHTNAIVILIDNGADVNSKGREGLTPLHAAVVGGHEDAVKVLIKSRANIDAEGIEDSTPLRLAVEGGLNGIVKTLIANGANVNAKSADRITPLLAAIKCNKVDIVEVLVANGANVDFGNGKPLSMAVLAGYTDIVNVLLTNKAATDINNEENISLLYLAAKRGHKEIIKELIKFIKRVDTKDINNETPLYCAAYEGHSDVVEILIENGANVNARSNDGTALHVAAGFGHSNVVEVLLKNNANIYLKDYDNRTPLELAVGRSHLQVVKTILQYRKVDMNTKGNGGNTLLHIASQEDNLEIVKYLVEKGSDIHAKNSFSSKPIHIAAREGFKDTVEFFLNKGLKINDLGSDNHTLLHYAAMKGGIEVAKYLISLGQDVNVRDINGLTPLHLAAYCGSKKSVDFLLKNGAFYNAIDKRHLKASDIARSRDAISTLLITEKLFDCVKRNSNSDVERWIKEGAVVNAKSDSGSALHYAAWKGYDKVVKLLLENKANPNVRGSKGYTPIHYAAKFSHTKVVKALLFFGAVYNSVGETGKTPSKSAGNREIADLFKLISDSFEKVRNGNANVLNDLRNIKDIDTVKAVMGARNSENKSLVVVAMDSKFSKLEDLKQVWHGDVSTQINEALVHMNEAKYVRALNIFRNILLKRKEILGLENPGTLDIQIYIGKALFGKGSYKEALNVFEEVYQKQKALLGLNSKDALNTRSLIAFMLHTQGKDKEAIDIYEEVFEKQKESLGANHSDTLDTRFHMALALDKLGKYEEALQINRAVFQKRKETSGSNDPSTLRAQNNIALVLTHLGKYEEAFKIYKEVYEKKKIVFGLNHVDTLRTLSNIAGVVFHLKKYDESLKAHKEVLSMQKSALGPNHPETLRTQYNLANVLFEEGRWIGALKVYKEALHQMTAVFGCNHEIVLDVLKKLEQINFNIKIEHGKDESETLQHLQKDINIVVSKGDIQTLETLLKNGVDVNDKDIEGRTPLHFAVSSGQISIVNILPRSGADITQVTNKGNTPLHTAISKGYKEIVEALLQNTTDKLNSCINARTVSSGTTALHVAAKNGSLEIVKCLLKHGAVYNIENKEGKTASNLSNNSEVTNFLKLVEELFEDTKRGNVEVINKLTRMNQEELLAVLRARNDDGKTLLRVAIAKGYKDIVSKLLKIGQ